MKPSEIIVGQVYRINPNGRSRMARNYPGRVIRIVNIHGDFGMGYVISDIPHCRGIWFDELGPYEELTYETI
jgi:hypothetical protein